MPGVVYRLVGGPVLVLLLGFGCGGWGTSRASAETPVSSHLRDPVAPHLGGAKLAANPGALETSLAEDIRVSAGIRDELGSDVLDVIDRIRSELLGAIVRSPRWRFSPVHARRSQTNPYLSFTRLVVASSPGGTVDRELGVGELTAGIAVIECINPIKDALKRQDHLDNVDKEAGVRLNDTKTTTEDVSPQLTAQISVTLSSALRVNSGSGLSSDATATSLTVLVDKATGRESSRLKETTTARVEVDFCPDAQGIAAGTAELTLTEDLFGSGTQGRAGRTGKVDIKTKFGFVVDDDAQTRRLDLDTRYEMTSRGGSRKAGQSQSELQSGVLSMRFGTAWTTSGTHLVGIDAPSYRASIEKAEGVVQDDVDRGRDAALTSALSMIEQMHEDVQAKWQGGACVEIIVVPRGRNNVSPGARVAVTAKVRHKIENIELKKTVKASLAGTASLKPVRVPLPSPASFEYGAGGDRGDEGTITLRSVSNRGIGETEVSFSVNQLDDYRIDFTPAWRVSGMKCGGPGGQWVLQISAPGSTSGTISIYIDEHTLTGTTRTQYHVDNLAEYDLSGTATVRLGDPPHLVLGASRGTVTIHVPRAPSRISFVGSRSAEIPLEVGHFCTEADSSQ